jgi:Domain of unknown function (DUF4383)
MKSVEAETFVLAGGSSESPFVRYTRVTAVAFLLVVVYTLVTKVPGGEIRDDWLHTVLHLVTGIVAVSVGWIVRSIATAQALTIAIGLGYGALGIAGWFIDGLLLDTEFAVPLAAADNVFHMLLAGGAALAGIVVSSQRRSSSASNAVRRRGPPFGA